MGAWIGSGSASGNHLWEAYQRLQDWHYDLCHETRMFQDIYALWFQYNGPISKPSYLDCNSNIVCDVTRCAIWV